LTTNDHAATLDRMRIKAVAAIVALFLLAAGCATGSHVAFPASTDERARAHRDVTAMHRRATFARPSWERGTKSVSSVKVGAPARTQTKATGKRGAPKKR
jgi:hypothetical protein